MFNTLWVWRTEQSIHIYLLYGYRISCGPLWILQPSAREKNKTKTETKRRAKKPPIIQHVYWKPHHSSYSVVFFFSKLLSKYTHSFSKDLLPEKYMRIFSKILDAQDVNVKAKSIKPLKNSDAKLCYLGLGSDFLDISPEPWKKKSKIWNLCASMDTIKIKVRTKPVRRKKTFIYLKIV